MSENDSHVTFHHHHYIENSSSLSWAGVSVLVILFVVVVILFLIVIGVIIYLIVYLSRHRHPRRPRKPQTTREMQGYDNDAIDDTSSSNVARAAASTEGDVCDNDNDYVESIPMRTIGTRSRTDGRRQDSSDSSAGLYDVLFPKQHEEEVMYDPPTKLMTFAGQVFASDTRPGSDAAGPRGSGQPGDSDSLVWDYFQQSAGTPANSEVVSDVDPGVIDDICWV